MIVAMEQRIFKVALITESLHLKVSQFILP